MTTFNTEQAIVRTKQMIDLPSTQALDRINALLSASESRTLDFKRIKGKQAGMYEAVCAFANTDGGWLVIGIGDAKAMKQVTSRRAAYLA